MLYVLKYRPPAITTRPAAKSMPQLDFREALSTPEENLFSSAATVATDAAQGPFKKNGWPADLTQTATAIDTTNPTGVRAPGSGTSLISDAISLVSELNLLPPGADRLFQSFLSDGNINDAEDDDYSNSEEHNQLDAAEKFPPRGKSSRRLLRARLQLQNRHSKSLTRLR